MNKLYITWEQSLNDICLENGFPHPDNNISPDLKNILNNHIIVFENWFWDLNDFHLRWIFETIESKKIIWTDNQLKFLLWKHITKFKNIEFCDEEININNKQITFENCKWKKLEFNNCNNSEWSIDIQWTSKLDNIEFNNCFNAPKIKINLLWNKIQKLNFINFQTEQSLDINIKEVKQIKINRSYFESRKVSFTNINISDILSIKNSSLGQMSLNWLLINSLFIKNSNLTSVFFNAVQFPNNNTLLKTDDKRKKVLSNEMMKDNYRQLKYAMDNNGNFTEGNKFFSNEMNSYIDWLNIKNITLNLIQKLYQNNFKWRETKELWEYITLNFSSNVNDFWNNWLRPLFLIFFLSFTATVIDACATLFWDIKVFFVILFMLTIDIIISFFSKPEKIINYLVFNLKFFISFIIFALIFFQFYIEDFNSLKVIALYINPIWLLPEYDIINNTRYFYSYNWIELLSFAVYKILYWILLWHLIVAAKRTTKR